MTKRRWHGAVLNIGTTMALAGAGYVVATERLIPAWNARAIVRVGETAAHPVELLALEADATIRLPLGRPVLLSVYRSTCSACERAMPGWADLARRLPDSTLVLGVGLEAEAPALAYARRMMPQVLAARPAAPSDFVNQFDIKAVPTTLLFDSGGRLVAHRTGPLEPSQVDELVTLVSERIR